MTADNAGLQSPDAACSGAGAGRSNAPEKALLEDRESPRLADEHVCNLAHLNTDEEAGVAHVLLVQPLPEGLGARDAGQCLLWALILPSRTPLRAGCAQFWGGAARGAAEYNPG